LPGHVCAAPYAVLESGLGFVACADGVPTVHLGVAEANARAIAFYERIGLRLTEAFPGWRACGRSLDA
jgi:ribosomal protein S18 acetylase RimI-like enzyme